MEHISTYLVARKRQLQEEQYQLSIFSLASEKGSGEWKAFNAVRDDSVSAYPVQKPRKAIVMREPRHVLRIVYPNYSSYQHAL